MAENQPPDQSSESQDTQQVSVSDTKPAIHAVWQQDHIASGAALKEFCYDYAKYLEFPDLTKKQFQNLEETVENMLARIDEFGAFVDTITADTNKSSRSFALLQEKCTELTKMFPVIDAMQTAVDRVKNTVDILEERTSYAEKQMGKLNIGFDTQAFKWLANKMTAPSQPIQIDQEWAPVNLTTAEEFLNTIRAAQPTNTTTTAPTTNTGPQ